MPRSYVTNLRKGRIENPGYEKMRTIARAIGFPTEAWFAEVPGDETWVVPDGWCDVAGRVEHLFETVKNPGRASPTRTRRWSARALVNSPKTT